MTETMMAAAFVKAGYAPPMQPADRLKAMMREAIRRGGGKSDGSRDYFVAALVKADDAALLWELFEPVRAAIIGRLFTETLIEMRAEGPPIVAGEAEIVRPKGQQQLAEPAPQADDAARVSMPKGQKSHAASSAPLAAAEAGTTVPNGREIAAKAAAPVPRPSRVVLRATADVARQSILDTFRKIGNQPLREVTGGLAREWLRAHQRDGRFVSLLVYDVPDEVKIGAIMPDDEAERLYKLAMEAGNA